MRVRLGAALPLMATLAALPGGAAAQRVHPHPAPVRYLLSLGDSLSQGMQPDPQGRTRNTNQGYADQLFALERRRLPGLRLVKLGCGGESTKSMLTGHGNDGAAKFLHCNRTGGSQLAAAVRFLRAHPRRGEVALVTVDIGANDIDFCASPGIDVGTCVSNGLASVRTDVPKILVALRRAAPAGTTFAAMTLYDPALAGYFDPAGRGLAAASVAILRQLNDELTAADKAAGFRTADVAGAFASYDSKTRVSWEGQSVPVDVARVCSWTWACSTPPSGPNIHANENGYAVIAGQFARVIGRLH